MSRRNWMRRCGALAAAALLSPVAMAQNYPAKPVRLVVPFAPGGTTDIVARVLGEKIHLALGQQMIVDNKAGGGGIIGANEIVKSNPDGYTLGVATVSTTASNPAINPKTPYNPLTDFTSIINVAATPNVIAVHPSFPAKDYKSFAELLRKEPGKHSYASAGQGSVGHLMAEVYKSEAQVFVTHIPYRGSGPALNDVVAGQVSIVADNLPTSLPFIVDKRLVPIVVAAPQRLAQLPNVPTFSEVGLPSVNRMSFLGVSAPKGTPKAVADKLNAAINTALADPAIRQRIEATGGIVVGNSSAEYQKQVKDEFEIYKAAVKTQGLKPD